MPHAEKAPARRVQHHAVATYVAHGLAESTRRGYAADLRHFRAWGGRIPASAELVASYLVAHAEILKASTLTRRLAAIASAHTMLGKDSPTRSPLIRATLRGIRRVHGSSQKQAKPLTPQLLRVILRSRHGECPWRQIRDRALLLTGFAGGFRRSELAQITPRDLTFSRKGVSITLRHSKTDPAGKGRVVALPSSGGSLCPVNALRAWLTRLRSNCPDAEGKALFRRIDRYGHLGGPLGAAAVGPILQKRLALCGMASTGFSAHSLRAGLVTSAALAGVPIWSIQRQTGHRSEAMVHRYIRGLTPFQANAFGAIARTTK